MQIVGFVRYAERKYGVQQHMIINVLGVVLLQKEIKINFLFFKRRKDE